MQSLAKIFYLGVVCDLNKKLLTLIIGGIFLIALAACSKTTAPTETNSADVDPSENMNEASELNLPELFKKTEEANNKLESFSLHMDLTQTFDVDGQEMNINSDLTLYIITDPFRMKQTMILEHGDLGEQEMETYVVEDGVFLFEPEQEEWLKFPKEVSDDIIHLSESQTELGNQIIQFEEFVDDISIDQEDNYYVLSLNATGDQFNEMLTETIKNSMPQEFGFEEDISNHLHFDHAEYEIGIYKNSFHFAYLDVIMNYEMDIEGEKIQVQQDIQSTYSEHNEIKEITVPQDVIDNAIEID